MDVAIIGGTWNSSVPAHLQLICLRTRRRVDQRAHRRNVGVAACLPPTQCLTRPFSSSLLRGLQSPNVTIYERSSSSLSERGVGLAVVPAMFGELSGDPSCRTLRHVPCNGTVVIADGKGGLVKAAMPQVAFVSYDSLMSALLPAFRDLGGKYIPGKRFVSIETSGSSKVAIQFADGSAVEADLVCGCDGSNSEVRNQLLKLSPPKAAESMQFDGLVGVRGVLETASLPEGVLESMLPSLEGKTAYNIIYDPVELMNFVAYLIPSHSSKPGGPPRLNFGFYMPCSPDLLDSLLTDKQGRKQESIPQGGASAETTRSILDFTRSSALADHPQVIRMAEMLAEGSGFLLTPIKSFRPPAMAWPDCRTFLLGDAAAVASPMTASGFARAYADAKALVEALRGGTSVAEALREAEGKRLPELRAIVESGRRREPLLRQVEQLKKLIA
ncbi:hypothetical protein DFJ74DRAFT_694901 [Hyaloraphidium curvatum]|nr:hypothetical protein DFJ74DRAFT_694901 [Hyaloraphidium curvatum]